MQKLKKATFTALSIIPTDIDYVQKIRQAHDPAFERWPPHVNICFPFVDPSEFDKVFDILQKQLSQFPSFKIRFNSISCFKNKTAVMFAQPETESDNISKLFHIIYKIFPELDDGIKKSSTGQFHAHMTLGKFPQQQVDKAITKYQQDWKPIEYLCDEIYFLQRDKQTPMQIVRTIKLMKTEQ